MSLKVVVIDSNTGKVVNSNGPHILIDESPADIKAKLFAFNPGFDYIPNLLKLELEINSEKQVVVSSTPLTATLTRLPEQPRLYITNIFTVIETLVDITQLFSENTLSDSDLLNSTLERLHEAGFVSLTIDDLEFVIRVIMMKMNPVAYSNFKADIEEYITLSNESQRKLERKYRDQEAALTDFYDTIDSVTDFTEYMDSDFQFNYTNIALEMRGRSFESGVKGRFIKLSNIFNQYQLTEKIPFVAMQNVNESRDPMIKVYNKLLERVSQKDIRSWVLNEKKKRGIMSYKKVKGLTFKFKYGGSVPNESDTYMTVSITDSGIIEAKIAFEDDRFETNLDKIVDNMKKGVDELLETINRLQGVFVRSRRLELSGESEIIVSSLSGYTVTKTKLSKQQLTEAMYHEQIATAVFELKETRSEEMVSMYYKKFQSYSSDPESERKGLTVNIKDNPYKLDSSIITVYGASNLAQIQAIVKQVIVLSLVYESETADNKQKLKQKSHIKNLRKQGVDILSTKCQKPRQPAVDSSTKPVKGSYTLEYKNIKYVCPGKEYPYPGFTNENIVCCFKKDQRRRPAYIRNIKSEDFDILVQPSNFKIRVTDNVAKSGYETFAIKVVSDYVNGFDDTNSMSRYYFLSNDNNLIAITNPRLIEELESAEEQNIWLDSMSLVKLTTEPPKNKCNFPPKLENKSAEDINATCQHHRRNRFFGYNINSYPCCFDKPREPEISRKRKETDITKQHLLLTDKILDYQRIGVLPPGLDKLFNGVISSKMKGKFYRMGVLQNANAFFNAVLLACENKINNKQVNNAVELKKYLQNYLENSPEEFQKLNSGNISLRYGSLDSYINSLLETQTRFPWTDIQDLLQLVTKRNIIILDIPYKASDSTKIADYENIKLLCNPNVKQTQNLPFIILLKRLSTFEVVIFANGLQSGDAENGSKPNKDDKSKIVYTFKYQPQGEITSNVVNFLVEYYSNSCVKENVYPESFPYQEMLNLSEITNALKDTPHEIVAQVVNRFRKVEYILTRKGVLVPIKDSGISDVGKVISLSQLVKANKLLDLNTYRKGLEAKNGVNQHLRKTGKVLELIGAATERHVDDELYYTAVFTNFGKFVPLAQTVVDPRDTIRLLDFKYYPGVDDVLVVEDQKQLPMTAEHKYNLQIRKIKGDIFGLKRELGARLQALPNIRQKIIDVTTDTSISRYAKIQQLVDIFTGIIGRSSDQQQTNTEFLLQHIANEVLDDNIENLLLHNLVTSEAFNPEEITKRDTESVLFNIDDIQRWIKRFNTDIQS